MDFEPIGIISSKLKRDEIYSFLVGFGIALIYFLSFTLKCNDNGEFQIIFNDAFTAALVLIAGWLFATFLNALANQTLIGITQSYANKKLKNKNYQDAPIQILNLEAIKNFGIDQVHIFSIMIGTCFWLAILPFLLKLIKFNKLCIIWPICVSAFFIVIGLLLYFMILRKNCISFIDYNNHLNNLRAYVGANDSEWCNLVNNALFNNEQNKGQAPNIIIPPNK